MLVIGEMEVEAPVSCVLIVLAAWLSQDCSSQLFLLFLRGCEGRGIEWRDAGIQGVLSSMRTHCWPSTLLF